MSAPTYTFAKGTDGENFEPKTYSDLGDMVGKIALQIIREAKGFNPLSVFKKKLPENGDTIEQAIVEMASAEAYDKTGANALSRKDPSIVVRYFNDWTRRKFRGTTQLSEMAKVLKTGKGAGELVSKVINSLNEGDIDEDFTQMKNLLAWGRQDGDGKVFTKIETIPVKNGKIDYQEVLVQMKDAVKGMQYSNDDYNTASLKRRTNLNDIYILMPYKLKNRMSVEELAGVFNLKETEIEGKMIELDTGLEEISGLNSYVIYIVDQNAIMNYNRLREMLDQKNADGGFWNYFLHSEDMYGLSPLFDCGYLVVNTEVAQAQE